MVLDRDTEAAFQRAERAVRVEQADILLLDIVHDLEAGLTDARKLKADWPRAALLVSLQNVHGHAEQVANGLEAIVEGK